MKNKIYLFPKVIPSENPYMIHLENSISPWFEIVNNRSNRYGVADLFRYLFKAEIFYFNWIENLSSRRYGKLQICLFLVFLLLAKSFGRKIVWTLHNKYSHDKETSRWVNFMFRLMFKYSDLIITHSEDGISFAKEKYPHYSGKIIYFIHPVIHVPVSDTVAKPEYDFFIWGTIWPYKGIIEFLRYLSSSGNGHLKTLIAGICINNEIKAELRHVLMDNALYIDHFFSLDEIAKLALKARFILFTYSSGSVLSSGSLMDSIGNGSVIIGPDTGAFRDLSGFKFVKTYKNFSDIIDINTNYRPDLKDVNVERATFCKENSWEVFGYRLSAALTENLGLNQEMKTYLAWSK